MARFAAGDRAEAQAACVTGELVDFSLLVCFVLLFFFFYYREALTDLSSRKKEQVLA